MSGRSLSARLRIEVKAEASLGNKKHQLPQRVEVSRVTAQRQPPRRSSEKRGMRCRRGRRPSKKKVQIGTPYCSLSTNTSGGNSGPMRGNQVVQKSQFHMDGRATRARTRIAFADTDSHLLVARSLVFVCMGLTARYPGYPADDGNSHRDTTRSTPWDGTNQKAARTGAVSGKQSLVGILDLHTPATRQARRKHSKRAS